MEGNYIFIGGRFDGRTMKRTEVEKIDNGRYSEDSSCTSFGQPSHRSELDNQPQVDGYIGPMWEDGHFRYESEDIFEMLTL